MNHRQEEEAYSYAYGNQVADEAYLTKVLRCSFDDLPHYMAQIGLRQCDFCDAWEEIDNGTETEAGWFCEDCAE